MNGTANLLEYANFSDAIAASFGGPKTAIPDEYNGGAPSTGRTVDHALGATTGGKISWCRPTA